MTPPSYHIVRLELPPSSRGIMIDAGGSTGNLHRTPNGYEITSTPPPPRGTYQAPRQGLLQRRTQGRRAAGRTDGSRPETLFLLDVRQSSQIFQRAVTPGAQVSRR